MAFGLLTTKWRILRRPLNYSTAKNAKIVRVCAKLHNFCIRMQQLDEENDGGGRIGHIVDEVENPERFGIIPVDHGGNMVNPFGYLPTVSDDDDFPDTDPTSIYTSLSPDSNRRQFIVSEIIARSLQRPQHNKRRNNG
jgi:hypothetical protein